jgi:hypothetical protein
MNDSISIFIRQKNPIRRLGRIHLAKTSTDLDA